jgi:hypothetical protein
MRKLIMRDLLLNRWILLIGFMLLAAYIPYPLLNGFGRRAFSSEFLMATLIPFFALFFREDQTRTLFLSASLPVTRRSIVRAKYVSAWIIYLAVVLFSILWHLFLILVIPGTDYDAEFRITTGKIIPWLLATAVVFAVQFPFVLRFGSLLGVVLMFMCILLLGLITYVTPPLQAFLEIVFTRSSHLVGTLESKTPGARGIMAIGIVAAVISVLMFFSYLVAARLFEKREL